MEEEKKKKFNRYIIIILILVAVFFIYRNNFRQTDDDKVLAVVGAEEILYSDVKDAVRQSQQQLNSMSQDQILDQLINMQIAKIYADSQGYFDNQEYREEFEWQKEEAKKGVMASVYLEKRAKDKTNLDNNFYRQYIVEHPHYKVITIFKSFSEGDSAKVEKQMNKAYNRLMARDKFVEVRADYMDKEYLNSGKTEEIIEADIVNSLLPTELRVGEFSEPIYAQKGFHIIKRLENPTLDEFIETKGNEIKTDEENSYMRNYADSLKREIRISECNLRKAIQSKGTSLNSESIIARLDNYNLDGAYFKKFFKNSLPQAQIRADDISYIENLTKELTLQNYLYRLAERAGIQNSPEYKNKEDVELALFDQGWENFIISKVYTEILSKETNVSDAEIKNYYDSHIDEFTQDGSPQPLTSVKYRIKYTLQEEKLNRWFENVKTDLNIKVDKK